MTEPDNNDDDAPLRAFADLDAWAPPAPPPAGPLADAVLARMSEQPNAAAAREHAAAIAARRSLRWTVFAAAATVVGAGVGVITLLLTGGGDGARAPEVTRGEVFAARAVHVALGPSAAELDPGAEVRWKREGGRLSVAQPSGAATWRAGGGDTLVIDAGAAVASVEASGASLRVEVQMNQTDARVIGASALTAAAVTLVTVIVYQGHVKLTSAGETVSVEPGAIMEVRPRERAREVPTVAIAPPSPEELEQELRGLRAKLEALQQAQQAQRDRLGRRDPSDPSAPSAPPEPLEIDALESPFMPGRPAGGPAAPRSRPAPSTPAPRPAPSTPAPVTCDAATLADRGRDLYSAGRSAEALAAYERSLACKSEPRVQKFALLAACSLKDRSAAARHYARLSTTDRSQVLAVCVRNGITEADLLARSATAQPAKPAQTSQTAQPCDSYELSDRGRDAFGAGHYAMALQHYDAAIACSPRSELFQKAFVVACNLPSLSKATAYWAKLTPAQRMQAVNVCVRNGITEDDLNATAAQGTLVIDSTPPATVFVDGVEVGTSPLTVEVPPGRHKVTFAVGNDKYTFAVTAKAGETVTLDKNLH